MKNSLIEIILPAANSQFIVRRVERSRSTFIRKFELCRSLGIFG